jgi:hypothetical protein
MKDITSNIILYTFIFAFGAILFVLVSALCGMFVTHDLAFNFETASIGAPFLIGALIVSAIIKRALKTS